MKVLWFTNTPSMAAELLNYNTVGGGWIDSLENRLTGRSEIELAVAFRFNRSNQEKIKGKKSIYYILPDKKNVFQKLYRRHFQVIDNKSDIEQYLEIIKDFSPDLIHIFGTENNFGLVVGRTNIPVVIHLQGILTVYELKWNSSGLNNRFLLSHSSLKKILLGNSLFQNYFLFKKAARREKQIFLKNKNFMGRTDWDRRLTSVLSPNAKYYHCEEIIRPHFYDQKWEKKPANLRVFLSTIQPNVYKGLETVLLTGFILQNVNLHNYEWRLAGICENEEIIRMFEKYYGKKFSKNGIRFLGHLKQTELIQQMMHADIFIHPSHIENSPNSICEAMLVGMPVIATYSGGTGSLINDKKEGILIQDGDPYAMAGAIIELCNDHEYACGLGKQARARALQRHDPDSIITKLVDIYNELIDNKEL